MGLSRDFGSGPGYGIRFGSTSRLDEMRCKEGIDESGFAQTGLTWKYKATSVWCGDQVFRQSGANDAADESLRTDHYDIELKAALQELVLNLPSDS